MNISSNSTVDKMIHEMLLGETLGARLRAIEAIGKLNESDDSIVLALIVARKSSSRDLHEAIDNALSATPHKKLLEEKPELLEIGTNLALERKNRAIRRDTIRFGCLFLILGIIGTLVLSKYDILLFKGLIEISNPLWGIIFTLLGILILGIGFYAIRKNKNV